MVAVTEFSESIVTKPVFKVVTTSASGSMLIVKPSSPAAVKVTSLTVALPAVVTSAANGAVSVSIVASSATSLSFLSLLVAVEGTSVKV